MEKIKNPYRYAIVIIALAGLVIMSYLTYVHYANTQSFCDLSAEVSCDVVTTSIYSEVFSVPVSILGIFYFGLVFLLSLFKKEVKIFEGIFLLSIFVIIPSLYLSSTEVLFIKSFCILCETSKVLMFVILGVSLAAIKPSVKGLLRMTAPVIIAGIVVAGVTYFAQTSVKTTEDLTPLVEHLNEQGWVYYKSYTCSNCRRQEQIIGPAYTKLNSVECHPEGPGGQPELCLEKEIDKTPTWLLEPEGEEVMRLEGTQSIKELEKVSGYK